MIRWIFAAIFFFSSTCYGLSPTFLQIVSSNSIVADGVLGQTTHDTSHTGYATNIYHDKFQPTTAGPVNYIHAYIADGDNQTICLSITSSDGTEIANYSADPGTDAAGWFNGQLSSEVSLVSATNYYLTITCSVDGGDNSVIIYQRNAGDGGYVDANAGYTCGDNINPEESSWYSTDDICIIVNNSPGDPS